jgi:hypothetical protein
MRKIIKFYLHGLMLTLVGLAFSFSLDYIDVNTNIGLIASIALMFAVLPCSFALVNALVMHKLYKFTIYSKINLPNFYADGLLLTILIIATSTVISKISLSFLINIVMTLLTPLIFGYIAYKVMSRLYKLKISSQLQSNMQ